MPRFDDTSQCKHWLFETPAALQEVRRRAYTSTPAISHTLHYRQTEYPLKDSPLCFVKYMLAGQIANPYQTVTLALCDLRAEKAKNLGRFVITCDHNEVISVSVFVRQFITVAIKCYPEIQAAYNRMMQRFVIFSERTLHNSFLYYQLWTAEVLARRMTCFLDVALIHPLSPLLISILLSFKMGSCDYFQRREAYVSRLYDTRYIAVSPYMHEACGIRPDDPARDIRLRELNKKTSVLLSEMYRMMKKHELYLLQKLNFSVYCVLANDYIDGALVSTVLSATGVPALQGMRIEDVERELEFMLAITRITDCYLLCAPDTIAVYCIVEAALLHAHRTNVPLEDITREKVFSRVTDAAEDRLKASLYTIRDTLFYFVDGAIPDVPQAIVEDARQAASRVMPLDGTAFHLDDYQAFLQRYFSFRVVMVKDE